MNESQPVIRPSAQQRFDDIYISALEIQRRLKVARCTLTFAHQRGSLPPPIVVGAGTHIWERAVAEPFMILWEQQLTTMRAKREKAG